MLLWCSDRIKRCDSKEINFLGIYQAEHWTEFRECWDNEASSEAVKNFQVCVDALGLSFPINDTRNRTLC